MDTGTLSRPDDVEMLIGGRFEAGAEEAETILNPRTGETVMKLAEASTDQISEAVSAADRAFAAWSRTTPAERSSMLLKLADFIAKERLCCPFFGFALQLEPEGGELWLSLTGREGVKPFIQAEIGGALRPSLTWS